MSLISYLKSTILSKVVMALTGVILVLFIIGHMVGNLQVFAGKEVFNSYAHFLQSLGELLWLIRIVLLLSLVLHIITSIYLKFKNNSARPEDYKFRKYVKSTLSARTMLWTGIMIFTFLVYHLLHFTVGVADPEIYGHTDYYDRNASFIVSDVDGTIISEGESYQKVEEAKVLFERHDAFYMVVQGFRKPLVSFFYLVAVIILGFHLSHAIQSMFQTLGLSGPKFTKVMEKISNLVAVLVVLGYISIPVSVMLRLVGGNI